MVVLRDELYDLHNVCCTMKYIQLRLSHAWSLNLWCCRRNSSYTANNGTLKHAFSSRRFRVQNYVTYTNGPRQLQFVVDAVGGVRKLDVKFSNSVSGLPASSASYGVVLLDKYLQPNVSCTCTAMHFLVW